ncbi:MAG: DUF1365 family protein [Thiolinea sp.]
MHSRRFPVRYRFSYRIFSFLLDIDRLEEAARNPLFSFNHFNLFSLYQADHGARDGSEWRPWVEQTLREHDITAPLSRIQLLCMPRILGYGFNPLSVWFCYAEQDALLAVICEVRNTFGEHHHYLLHQHGAALPPIVTGSKQKVFHVSPFVGMQARYEFFIQPPGDTLDILIHEYEGDELMLVASQKGTYQPFSTGLLLRQFLRIPFVSLKVMLLIHWQALKIWLQGATLFPQTRSTDRGDYLMSMDDTLPHPLALQLKQLPTFKRWLMTQFARIQQGRLSIHLDGEHYIFGHSDEIHASLHIHRPLQLVLKCLSKGDLGFGEAYLAGDWSSEQPADLLTLLLRNWEQFDTLLDKRTLLRAPANWLHKLRRNNVRNSRRNIAHHYDMGNDFYREWLDTSMTYSAALYSQPDMTLEQAQRAKYQRILDELQVKPGQSILEIGCGWGGFAEMAAEQGCKVHGITLSREQLAWAQQRLARFGNQTLLELRDYRHLEGRYDHIVSIEMFEAVGEEYWPGYFRTLERHLKPGGRAVLQTITIGDDWFATYRTRADYIQRYIFPGGMLPNPASLQALIAGTCLRETSRISFGKDYARTLREWDERFRAALPKLRPLGYDQRFERLWRYYLAYCEAGFNEGRIDVIQVTLEKS